MPPSERSSDTVSAAPWAAGGRPERSSGTVSAAPWAAGVRSERSSDTVSTGPWPAGVRPELASVLVAMAMGAGRGEGIGVCSVDEHGALAPPPPPPWAFSTRFLNWASVSKSCAAFCISWFSECALNFSSMASRAAFCGEMVVAVECWLDESTYLRKNGG